MPTKKGPAALSDQHKKALAEGRKHAAAVRQYLDALRAANAPKKKGRKRTPESIQARLDQIEQELAGVSDALAEVRLIQERLDLQQELEDLQNAAVADPSQFEAGFVESVGPYSESKGITYHAWRELGVPAGVLRKAGVSR